MSVIEEKYLKAIKAGVICGIPPAITTIIFLLTIYPALNFLEIPVFVISLFVYLLACIATVVLAIRFTGPFLNTKKDIVLLSGISGASLGATFILIVFIPITIWVLLLMNDFSKDGLFIILYLLPLVFIFLSGLIFFSFANACIAALIGALFYIIKKGNIPAGVPRRS